MLRRSPRPMIRRRGFSAGLDILAHEAGIPTSTVRLYQNRGLLYPPRREGRLGYYNTGHHERLQPIAHL